MTSDFRVLIDSDAWIGSALKTDAHHLRAKAIFNSLIQARSRIVTTSYVVDETMTVLSHRSGQDLARDFLKTITQMHLPIIHVDVPLRAEGIRVFSEQNKRGTSMVDCVNVAVMQVYDIPQIYAFDRVYHTDFGLANLVYTDMKHPASA